MGLSGQQKAGRASKLGKRGEGLDGAGCQEEPTFMENTRLLFYGGSI